MEKQHKESEWFLYKEIKSHQKKGGGGEGWGGNKEMMDLVFHDSTTLKARDFLYPIVNISIHKINLTNMALSQ